MCARSYMLCGNIRVERTTPKLDSTEAPLGRIHLPHGAVMIPLLIKDCHRPQSYLSQEGIYNNKGLSSADAVCAHVSGNRQRCSVASLNG